MSNKIALVTGAARGIGKAIALKLAQSSYDVIINYNGSEEAAKQVQEQCISYGVHANIVKCNVADYKAVEEMVNAIIKEHGKIDLLINNAGITKDNLILRMQETDFDQVIDINLKGCFNCIKHVSRPMLKAKSGKIINLASVIGITGNMGQANYAASKAGVIGLTKSVAKELASRGICVNAIAPGFIQTEMTEELAEATKEQILNAIPLKAFGKVEDVANLVQFLSSEQANYITGQVIHVDGGMVM